MFEREFGNLQLFLSKFWISFFFEINVSRKNITLDYFNNNNKVNSLMYNFHNLVTFYIVNFFYRIRSILIRKEDGYALVEARR